jgi:hypothetical protein
MKRIWIDVLTPKQARLFGAIYNKLKKMGYDVIVTARNYDYTAHVLHKLEINFIIVGGYANDLKGKLIEEAKRTIELLNLLSDFDALLAFPNPVAARIAFGLKRPYIAFTDSPHSEAPSRLALPLATAVIFSSCIPKGEIERYIIRDKTIVVQFNGVDEVEWLKDANINAYELKSIEVEPFNYIVIRPPEIKASYYTYELSTILDFISKLAERAIKRNYKVVYLPRYRDDPLIKRFADEKNIIIPWEGVEGTTLVYYARFVISGGGTMAREAALIGTPGISLFPGELYVNRCVAEWGFPLIQTNDPEKLNSIVEKLFNMRESEISEIKAKAMELLKKLEAPSSTLNQVLVKVLE